MNAAVVDPHAASPLAQASAADILGDHWPGIQIYYTAFLERQVGLASALAVALMVLVLVVILPVQRLARGGDR